MMMLYINKKIHNLGNYDSVNSTTSLPTFSP